MHFAKYLLRPTTLALGIIVITSISSFAQIKFLGGNDVVYSDTGKCDLFIAGKSVHVNSKVDGDVFASGYDIHIRDVITDDTFITGSKVNIDAEVKEDVRIFGGEVNINKPVGGDVLIFGGKVELNKEATVAGSVYLFSGSADIYSTILGDVELKCAKVKIDGTVEGNLEAQCEDANFNGVIKGFSNISADKIYVGKRAVFHNDVNYSSDKGEVDFGNSALASVKFSEELDFQKIKKEDTDETYAMYLFVLFRIIGMLVVIFALTYFNTFFCKAAIQIKNDFMSSIGWGTIVILGLPLISLFLLITVIGIPLGLIGLSITAILFVISKALASIILAHYINNQYNKNWSRFKLFIVAAAWYFAFLLLFIIPLLGLLITVMLIFASIGSIAKELKALRTAH